MADRSRSPAGGRPWHLRAMQTCQQGPDYVFSSPLNWPPEGRRRNLPMFWFRAGVVVLGFESNFSVRPLISHQNFNVDRILKIQDDDLPPMLSRSATLFVGNENWRYILNNVVKDCQCSPYALWDFIGCATSPQRISVE